MNQSEFANLHNVSRKTATKWKERGWLVMLNDKEVNVEASNANIKKYRVSKLTDRLLSGEGETTASQDDGEIMSLDESRRVKENYLALLAQLDYRDKSSKVVLLDDALKAVGEQYARVRERLLGIATEAPMVHRFKTVAEVEDCLMSIITEALEDLTKDSGAVNAN